MIRDTQKNYVLLYRVYVRLQLKSFVFLVAQDAIHSLQLFTLHRFDTMHILVKFILNEV